MPGFLRNAVVPVFGEDGVVWLLLQAEAEVRKYGPDGSLLFSRALDVPEVERAREDFFRLNRENENRITSYNVCYTKLLRDAMSEGAVEIEENGFDGVG